MPTFPAEADGVALDVQFLSFRPMTGYGTTELRCRQPVAFLTKAGLTAHADHVLNAPVSRCRLLVLHRVRRDRLCERIVDLARRRGARIVFDIDDYLSDRHDPTRFSPDIVGAMELSDTVTVSGRFLQDRVVEVHPDCRVLRNRLSASVLDQGRASLLRERKRPVTVGYFSGSSHHDADFGLVTPELVTLMRKYPDLRLVVGGKIEIDPALHEFGSRLRIEPFRPYAEFIGLLSGIDVNLAPLDTSSDFARARSEIKFLEAAAFGVPTVAMPTPAFADAIVDGETGFLAKPEDWAGILGALIESRELRSRTGRAARNFVEREYGPGAGQEDWTTLYRSLVDPAAKLRAETRGSVQLAASAAALRERRRAGTAWRRLWGRRE